MKPIPYLPHIVQRASNSIAALKSHAKRYLNSALHRQQRRSITLYAVMIAGSLFLAGCAGCSDTKITNQAARSTGQQLMDLDKAHKEGTITDKEYERLRKAIIKNND